jgi:hypothetical protein
MAEKEGLLPFKLIEDETGEALTSYSGLPLVLETCEALGLAGLIKQHVRIKQRQRGYSESEGVFRPKTTPIPLANRHWFRSKSAPVPKQIGTPV